jgi:hypothetical protein
MDVGMSPKLRTVQYSGTLLKRKVSVCEEPNGHYKRRGSGRDDQGACKGKLVGSEETRIRPVRYDME